MPVPERGIHQGRATGGCDTAYPLTRTAFCSWWRNLASEEPLVRIDGKPPSVARSESNNLQYVHGVKPRCVFYEEFQLKTLG